MVDARNEKQCLWSLNAHFEGINGMTLSPQREGFLVTASSDKTLKGWDITGASPRMVYEKDLKMGLLHSLDGCPEEGFLFAVGGDNPAHNMQLVDLSSALPGQETPEANDVEASMAELKVEPVVKDEPFTAAAITESSGGAISKFQKKTKKKKKKQKF